MVIVAAPSMEDGGLDSRTGFPRGALVCLDCDVSWSVSSARMCWNCGSPGVPSGVASNVREVRTQSRDL
jgi:hypothetical protein